MKEDKFLAAVRDNQEYFEEEFLFFIREMLNRAHSLKPDDEGTMDCLSVATHMLIIALKQCCCSEAIWYRSLNCVCLNVSVARQNHKFPCAIYDKVNELIELGKKDDN
jgi:hypothetical protein